MTISQLASPRLANGKRMIQRTQIMGQPDKTAVYMRDAVVAGVAALGDSAHEFTQAVYKALGAGVLPRRYPKQANEQLADLAWRAVLGGWRSRLPVRAPGYRAGSGNKDRLHGFLGAALANGDAMTNGTTDRAISFMNHDHLNRTARHWYRVNYGAFGPKVVVDRPKPFPVTVDGHTLFVLRDEAQPAPNSWLPQVWRSEGPAFFQPVQGPADIHGGGHRSALFTDLGYESIARNLDPVYDNMLRRYIDEQGSKGLADANIHVTVTEGTRPVASRPHFRAR